MGLGMDGWELEGTSRERREVAAGEEKRSRGAIGWMRCWIDWIRLDSRNRVGMAAVKLGSSAVNPQQSLQVRSVQIWQIRFWHARPRFPFPPPFPTPPARDPARRVTRDHPFAARARDPRRTGKAPPRNLGEPNRRRRRQLGRPFSSTRQPGNHLSTHYPI